MKEITKQIRKAVYEKIQEVGGTKNLLNKHFNEIYEQFIKKEVNESKCAISTAIENQIDYFRFSKNM